MRFREPGGLFFDQFRFDPKRRALYKQGRRVVMRAKVAEVLHVLLQSADQIVSKQRLRDRVWGHDWVSDQSLFQAISDLRRALAPLEAIVTHPNQGYRWAVSVRTRRRLPHAVAACLVAAVVAGAAFTQGWLGSPADTRGLRALSPSMQAFASGVAHLGAGDARRAEVMLSLALKEDGSFLDARLMLAEAFLAQGERDRAVGEARRVLVANEARAAPDAHAAVAAMALISRAEGSAGANNRALHWAFEAVQRAHRGGLVCTASDIERRIDRLLARGTGDAVAEEPLPANASAASPLSAGPVPAQRASLPAYCSKLPGSHTEPEARTWPGPCTSGSVPLRLAALSVGEKSTV